MNDSRTKRKKVQKILMWIFSGIFCIFLCLYIWKIHADKHIYEVPDYQKKDLSEVLNKNKLSKEEYQFLFMQTGLSEIAVDKLLAEGEQEIIYRIQDRFFAEPVPDCQQNSIISWEEWNQNEEDRIIFGDLQDGDILITPCSHTFGWRNGHAAIVVDAKEGKTLESVVLGSKSSVQTVKKWEMYPCVMVFRLKGVSEEERKEIAQKAEENLYGIDYGFDMGFLTPKYEADILERTHCAHLVWHAYRAMGYDLDSDEGTIVTPKDLSGSLLLEPVQVVGVNPVELWE